MPIGTSDGEYFETGLEYHTHRIYVSPAKSYDTELDPGEETKYQSLYGSDASRDYDMRGYFKANPDVSPNTEGVHYPDTFKKPNHPTFSDQSIYHSDKTPGGSWTVEDGKDVFTPSEYNINNLGKQGLQDYFQKVEPNVTLRMPPQASTEPAGALESPSGTQTLDTEALTKSYLQKLSGTENPRPPLDIITDWAKEKITGMYNAIKLPGDALQGKIDPMSDEGLRRTMDLAGLMVMGPAPIASKVADGTLGSFAGVRSKSYDRNALAEAQVMKSNGEHADDVFTKTGWFQGVDGRWRHEIDDSKATVKQDWFKTAKAPKSLLEDIERDLGLREFEQIPFDPSQGLKQAKLSEVLDHPELYKAYPHLKDIKVVHDPNLKDYGGYWSSSDNQIVLGDALVNNKDTFLHEVQHAIQAHENFAKGGAALTAGKDYPLLYTPEVLELTKEANKLINAKKNRELTPKEQARNDYLSKVFKKYKEYTQAANEKASDLYFRLAGETESRNVETRAALSAERRRQIPPRWTEDQVTSKQIVSMGSKATTAYGLRDEFGRITPMKDVQLNSGGVGIQYNMVGDVFRSLFGTPDTKVEESKAPGLMNYPTQEDARKAIESDYGYGTGLEPYIKAEVARVYDKLHSGDLGEVLDQKTSNVDMTKLKNIGIRQKVGTLFAQAALAVNRSPIATLGFDPDKIGLQIKMDKTNLAGFFDPAKDKIWMNAIEDFKSTAVHESIHRGLEKLKQQSPEAKQLLKTIPEESLVRYMMATTMGDPEKGRGDESDKQRQSALDWFKKFPNDVVKISKLEEIAAELHKARRERGPR